mmetsp:Transcript_50738/g.114054  ORF Transcript_50738/g.114054 Transcript_50738/m.114054 type:complete len:196 (+) Transcript_50738:476-1063(+)
MAGSHDWLHLLHSHAACGQCETPYDLGPITANLVADAVCLNEHCIHRLFACLVAGHDLRLCACGCHGDDRASFLLWVCIETRQRSDSIRYSSSYRHSVCRWLQKESKHKPLAEFVDIHRLRRAMTVGASIQGFSLGFGKFVAIYAARIVSGWGTEDVRGCIFWLSAGCLLIFYLFGRYWDQQLQQASDRQGNPQG